MHAQRTTAKDQFTTTKGRQPTAGDRQPTAGDRCDTGRADDEPVGDPPADGTGSTPPTASPTTPGAWEMPADDARAAAGTPAVETRAEGGYPSVEDLVRTARARLERVSARTAADEQAAGALLVDLRSEGRRRIDGEVPGSLVLERSLLEFRLDPCSKWRLEEAVDHQLRVILFCPLGQMSSLAAGALHDLGLRRATDVVGGFAAWREAGLPVIPGVTAVGSYVGSPASAIDLDIGGQQLLVDGAPVALTRLEFRLVSELLRAGGRVVPREELRASIGDWPGSRSRSVDLHVHRIRRKLGPRAAGLLTTEWGIGFRLRTGRHAG